MKKVVCRCCRLEKNSVPNKLVESILKRTAPKQALPVETEKKRMAKYFSLLAFVSKKSGYSVAELTGRGRRRDMVRYKRAIVYLAVTHLGFNATSVGRSMSLSPSNALKALIKGEEIMNELGWKARELFRYDK